MISVKDFLEKSINVGLGLAAWSREKIEELVEELVRKGEVAQKDARQFATNLVQKGEEQKAELKKMINGEINAVLDKMDLVRKSEIQEQINTALQQAGFPAGSGQAAEKTEPASGDTARPE
jgi:polyhydroxyalkanoate synthesis regulator phasin